MILLMVIITLSPFVGNINYNNSYVISYFYNSLHPLYYEYNFE